MSIEATCKNCGARYRVDDRLAGKTAKCKHCGSLVPIPSNDPADTHTAPMEFALAPEVEKQETAYEDRGPLIPPIVSDVILPLIVSIICFACIAWMLIPRAMHSANPVIAFILIAFGIGLYCVIT